MTEKVVQALIWIKNTLEQQGVPYQIVGGLASHIHGGSRLVADIDLYIPREHVEKILPLVASSISKPLAHVVEGSWDLDYLQLIYQDQKIEIGLSPGTKILDRNTGQWCELVTDYSQSVMGKYEGVEVPVIPIAALVAYKALLGRDVDHIDIAELTGSNG